MRGLMMDFPRASARQFLKTALRQTLAGRLMQQPS